MTAAEGQVKELLAVLPALMLSVGALLVLFDSLLSKKANSPRQNLLFQGLVCALAWIFSLTFLYLESPVHVGFFYADALSFVAITLILIGVFLSFLLSTDTREGQGIERGIEYDLLLHLAALGGIVMVCSAHLLLIFLGLELLSLCVYILAASARKERASSEAGLKYFILGAFTSALLLYGIAVLYSQLGTLDLAEISVHLQNPTALTLIGLALLIVGFAFKVSLVPFHFWTPDVYQGSPLSVTSYLAVVVKIAAFVAFLRVMAQGFLPLAITWKPLFWALAVLTMSIANLLALRQQSVKRMLAYSSISHAGYMLLAFFALDALGAEALLFYLASYLFMTLGAFAVLLAFTWQSEAQYEADDFRSLQALGWSHPFLGFALSVFVLSLAGMPPFSGFFAKFFVFAAALRQGYLWLVIIAAINSVISLYYYLRVLVFLYFKTPRELSWTPAVKQPLTLSFSVTVALIFTLLLGVCAMPVYRLMGFAASSLVAQ